MQTTYFSFSTESTDLVDQELLFQIEATVDSITNSDSMITVQILTDTQTEEEIVPPHFDGDLIQSITLPCFNQEPLWKYSFPEGVS